MNLYHLWNLNGKRYSIRWIVTQLMTKVSLRIKTFVENINLYYVIAWTTQFIERGHRLHTLHIRIYNDKS